MKLTIREMEKALQNKQENSANLQGAVSVIFVSYILRLVDCSMLIRLLILLLFNFFYRCVSRWIYTSIR